MGKDYVKPSLVSKDICLVNEIAGVPGEKP